VLTARLGPDSAALREPRKHLASLEGGVSESRPADEGAAR
jgi:hypothetical protein